MKAIPDNVIMLIKIDGKWVQRPLKKSEINFVLPILQEFDGGTLKVLPAPDAIILNKDK